MVCIVRSILCVPQSFWAGKGQDLLFGGPDQLQFDVDFERDGRYFKSPTSITDENYGMKHKSKRSHEVSCTWKGRHALMMGNDRKACLQWPGQGHQGRVQSRKRGGLSGGHYL